MVLHYGNLKTNKPMAQQTAVEWFFDKLKNHEIQAEHFQLYQQAKQMEKDQIIEHSIGFQIYLNDKGLITNHDWDFEKLAKQYIKKEHK